MNANAFRQLFDYHFSENQKIWDEHITKLSAQQFCAQVDYSIGSIQDQLVHLLSVDDMWFSELQGSEPLDPFSPAEPDSRREIRVYWEKIEQRMRDYLRGLRDDMLLEKPITLPEEDQNLAVWQVLLHVINHGTDHRAQILRLLHDQGCRTSSQDLVFYLYDHI